MTGSRITVGLSVALALAFGAVAASGASAAGTTAYACILAEGKLGAKGFTDEHCTSSAEGTSVKFKHHEVEVVEEEEEATNFEASNENTAESTKNSTNVVLKSVVGGVELEIVCTSQTSEGRVWNHEVEGVMQTTGTATFNYGGCTAPKPTDKSGKEVFCKVKTPMTSKIKYTTSETLGGGEGMGIIFNDPKGEEETPFLEITFEEKKGCPFTLGKPTPVEGSAIATPNGSTLVFNAEEPGNTLSFLGNTVQFSAAQTIRMKQVKDEEITTPGAPLAFTTTGN